MAATFLWIMVGLVLVVLPPVSYAQQPLPPNGQMYFGRLGCSNCHGNDGRGGVGKPGGPCVANSGLSLRGFVGYVRLPSGMMPPFAPEWAADAELAVVYSWLKGADTVRSRPPITVEVNEFQELKAEENANPRIQIKITVLRALNSGSPDPASLRYRLTLINNGKAPVANQMLDYHRADSGEWLKLTTDDNGQALLIPDRLFIMASGHERDKARAQLRMMMPVVRTVVVIEALDPLKPDVLGVGSALLAAERKP